jgi:hypothetical protein
VRQDLAMQRHSLAIAAAAALVFLAGCGSDDNPKPADATSAEPTESASPSPTVVAPDDLVVKPGAVGPVRVGMSKEEAAATGMFDVDLPAPAEGCPPYPLQWKKQYKGLDVLTGDDEAIVSIGVTKDGPKTAEGIGFGSTLDDVKKAYPDLSPVAEAGQLQAGAFVSSGDGFIGFLFGDATKADIKGSSAINFIEVTTGTKPDLIRSGC